MKARKHAITPTDRGPKPDRDGSWRHGHAQRGQVSPTYVSWYGMMTRVTNPNAPKFARYGARGITVCQAWTSFEGFLRDMGERPSGHTIERIDNDGNYCPENCRWATLGEQARNMSTSARLVVDGREMVASEAAREFGIPYSTLTKRLRTGWSHERACKQPLRGAR